MAEKNAGSRPGGAGKIVVGLAFAAGLVAAVWLLWPADEPAPAPAPPPAAPAPPPAPPPVPELPTPEATPEDARPLLEGVSGNAAFRRWLGAAAGDLVRRWAIVTDNVAEGVSPRKQLDFLDPGGPFSVERRGGRNVIAERSYARYDRFADAVASVDAQALASVYRRLHPLLERAYRALGYPDGSLDQVTARALRRIAAVPVRDGEVAVVEEDGLWLYEDPALERLSEVAKHVLRMGPRNARLVQGKAKELRVALGFPAEPMKAR